MLHSEAVPEQRPALPLVEAGRNSISVHTALFLNEHSYPRLRLSMLGIRGYLWIAMFVLLIPVIVPLVSWLTSLAGLRGSDVLHSAFLCLLLPFWLCVIWLGCTSAWMEAVRSEGRLTHYVWHSGRAPQAEVMTVIRESIGQMISDEERSVDREFSDSFNFALRVELPLLALPVLAFVTPVGFQNMQLDLGCMLLLLGDLFSAAIIAVFVVCWIRIPTNVQVQRANMMEMWAQQVDDSEKLLRWFDFLQQNTVMIQGANCEAPWTAALALSLGIEAVFLFAVSLWQWIFLTAPLDASSMWQTFLLALVFLWLFVVSLYRMADANQAWSKAFERLEGRHEQLSGRVNVPQWVTSSVTQTKINYWRARFKGYQSKLLCKKVDFDRQFRNKVIGSYVVSHVCSFALKYLMMKK
jgi:hypothetical protein